MNSPQPSKVSLGLIIGWLFVPSLLAWLSFNYLVGMMRQPFWDAEATRIEPDTSILGTTDELWQPNGLDSSFEWNGQGVVTLWFDDAWTTQYSVAAPMMRSRDLVGAIAVTTNLIGYEAYITWPQVRRLAYDGWEITGHGRDHICDLEQATDEILLSEVEGGFVDLLKQGYLPNIYVPPCGMLVPEITQLMKGRYRALRTTEGQLNSIPPQDAYHLFAYSISPDTTLAQVQGWLDQARSQGGWLILIFHQIDVSGDIYSVSPSMFSQMLDLVVDSGLPVLNPNQVLQINTDHKL